MELFSSLGGSPDADGSWTPALAGANTYTYTHAAVGDCPAVSADVVVTEQTLQICEGSDTIPSISQWGLFILGMLISCFALIYIRKFHISEA